MSSNWQKYPRLKNNQANRQRILAMEKQIALRDAIAPNTIYSHLKESFFRFTALRCWG